MAEVSGLSINIEVIESMASIAALEVAGVDSLAARNIDLKKAVSGKSVFKAVRAEVKNGAVIINVYIRLAKDANAKQVAEAVQGNVKDKVQTMTGNAITGVNVYVADVIIEEEN
ncbi:MAG: Asp23/Gls24 family envelope stress response protein [Clostridia bacterium]|nr:Asp23/Gls24 family envelope stress response protein [Clostridia bacterium]